MQGFKISSMKVRAHVFVSGRVQGVFFRDYTRRMANKHGVTGWVRNLPDGRVEAIFEGEEEDVKKMIEWCHVGSPASRVDSVEVSFEPYTGEFENFRIRW